MPEAFRAEEFRILRAGHLATLGGAIAAEDVIIGSPALAPVIDERRGLREDADGFEFARNFGSELQGVEYRWSSVVREPQTIEPVLSGLDVPELLLLGDVGT